MCKQVLVLFALIIVLFACGHSSEAAEAKTIIKGNTLILLPGSDKGQCMTLADARKEIDELSTKGILVADVTCNGFWCGTGDDKICCDSSYKHCCKHENSDSYYCSNDSCP
jgi:hypothetical protein